MSKENQEAYESAMAELEAIEKSGQPPQEDELDALTKSLEAELGEDLSKGHKEPDGDGGKHLRCWFVTLTYHGVDDWQPRHLSEAFRAFRHWCKKRSIRPRYVWVAELQQRGALHYHIALWLPVGVSCPMWDKGGRNYTPFWPHGMTNRTLAKNAVGYLMKYMSKVGKYHEFPKGARIYGAGGLEPEQRQFKSWLNYPQWLKQVCAVGESVIRAGRRVLRETGEVLRSPYEIVRRYGSMYLRTVRPVPDAWVSGAWSRLNTAGPALPVSMPLGAA